MQYKWQLWLSCIVVLLMGMVLLSQYRGIERVAAASLPATLVSIVQERETTTNNTLENSQTLTTTEPIGNRLQGPTIIGGEEAAQGAWPWMVALIYTASTNAAQGQFCGGTLIAAEWVLSAAHCTYDFSGQPRQPAEIEVLTGQHQLSGSDGRLIAVTRIIRHPNYTGSTFDNDLALLHLATPADTEPLALIHPTQRAYEESGTAVTILGWGITDDGSDSDVLRQVEVPLVDLKTCRQSYGIFNRKVTDNMLCAGLQSGGKDSCQGDSGGPMIVFTEAQQQWLQLGIVSWGEGCAEPNYYGVYTRVSSYLEWIFTQIPQQITPVATVTATATPTPSRATMTATTTPLPTATPTQPITETPQAAGTATATLIPTTFATSSPMPTPTPSPTPSRITPGLGRTHIIFLPLIAADKFHTLENGDFESVSNRGWSEFSLQQQPLVIRALEATAMAHSGSYVTRLGGERGEISFVQQKITVPRKTPILEYWILIQSTDDCGYDYGGVVVDEQIADQFDLCRSSVTSRWQRREVDLRAYINATVSLEIRAETDGYLNSTLFVDDVKLIASAPAEQVPAAPASNIPERSVVRAASTTRIWPAAKR